MLLYITPAAALEVKNPLNEILSQPLKPGDVFDMERRDFENARSLLELGDTTQCMEEIARYFLHVKPRGRFEVWGGENDPVRRAKLFLDDKYLLGAYPAYELGSDLSWKESPGGYRNWEFLFHAMRILGSSIDAYRLSGNDEFILKGKDLITDFALDNLTPGKLPSWFSWNDHSVVYRTIHMIDFWRYYVETGDNDVAFASTFIDLLWRQAEFLYADHFYAWQHNHGIYNALALQRVALAFPQFKEAANWLAKSKARIEQQIRENFTAEGIEKEYSASYQVLTTSLLVGFDEDAGHKRGCGLSTTFHERLRAALMSLPYFFLPDGSSTLIGDTSLKHSRTLLANLRDRHTAIKFVQSMGARGHPPARSSRLFEEAQFCVMRSGWGENRGFKDEGYLIADLTEYGHAHQHMDFMNFELYSMGHKWITDPGVYSYNIDKWRAYMKSPQAHNIIVPAEKKQSRPGPTKAARQESREMNDRKQKVLSRELSRIEAIRSPEKRLEEYEKLLGRVDIEPGPRVLISIAFLYMEQGDSLRARELLKKVLRETDQPDYLKTADELLLVLGGEEPNFDDSGTEAAAVDDSIPAAEIEKERGNAVPDGTEQKVRHDGPLSRLSLSSVPPWNFRKSKPNVSYWLSTNQYDYLEGSFKYSVYFTHGRAIVFIKPYYFMIVDKIETNKNSYYCQFFHLPPEVSASVIEGGFLIEHSDGAKCVVKQEGQSSSYSLDIVMGKKTPELQGWFGGRFNQLERAPVLRRIMDVKSGSYFLISLIVPLGEGRIEDFSYEIRNAQALRAGLLEPVELRFVTAMHRVELSYKPSGPFLGMDASSECLPVVDLKIERR